MSRKFSVPIDLQRNELQNARIQNLASDPGTPVAGQVYYNTTTAVLRYYDGTAALWKDIGTTIPPASTVASSTTFGQAAAVGTGTSYARNDHVHGTPAAPTATSVGAVANGGGLASAQTGTFAAIPVAGQAVGNLYIATDSNLLYVATSATTYTQLAPFGGAGTTITATGSAAGTANSYSRSDHNHSVSTATAGSSAVGDAASAGTGTALALASHVHGREAFGAAVTASTTFGQTSAVGTNTTLSRSDHVHGTPATPTAAQTGAVANNGNAPYLQSGTAAARPATGLTVGGVYIDNDDFLAYIATSTTTYSQIAPFAAAAAVTAITITGAQAAGTANTYARGDHAHAGPGFGLPSASAVGDAQATGTAATVSHSDHVHARETFGAVTAQTTFGLTSANGTAVTLARADHTHGTPAAPTASSVGAVANAGGATSLQTGTAAARPATGQVAGNIYVDNDDFLIWIATGATTFTQLAAFGASVANVAGTTQAPGTATTYARSDHQHGLGTIVTASTSAVGNAASGGTSTTAARADHVHGREAFAAVTAQTTFGTAAADGTAVTLARSDHVHGTPTHNTAAHSAVSISGLSAPTADVPWGGFKITNLADPTLAQDAVTKSYADNLRAGISLKDPVRLATAADLNGAYTATATVITGPANTALANIDGVAPAVNDRVLVKNAAAAANNGIYVVTSLGSGASQYVLTRSTDADTTGEIVDGTATWVQTGATNGDTRYVATSVSATPWVPGTTTSAWTLDFAATSVTAGAGLTATGGVLAVGSGNGITVNADNIQVDAAVVVRKFAAAFGDGTATSFTITHNLGTQDVTVAVYINSGTFEEYECDVQHTSANVVTLLFSVAPTASQYRVVVHG